MGANKSFRIKHERITNMMTSIIGYIAIVAAILFYGHMSAHYMIKMGNFDIKDPSLEFVVACLLCIAIVVFATVTFAVNVSSQKRVADLLYKDPITRGNNWFYLENAVPRTLSIFRFFRRGGYDCLVTLSLMKYQSYCACHSIEEGEDILWEINKSVSSHLGRSECIARYQGSDFAIFMHSESEEKFKERLDIIMKNLANVAPEHRLVFHAGVMPISVDETKMQAMLNAMAKHHENVESSMRKCDINALVSEKKRIKAEKEEMKDREKGELSLNQLYMYASTARDTLELKEDNGVAFFDQSLIDDEVWEHQVEDTMYDALKNEEFKVYIQPKYAPGSKILNGAEALVRWISPTHGFVSPGRFIPVFEKNGFITELDDYMVAHVAKMQSDWLKEGFEIVPVSVNISRAHFLESDLAEHICEIVDKYGTPHEYIEIELTESAFFDDKKALLDTIKKLQSYGFEVSMDDFGSGYSSLNSLRELPLDVLKLDAEFFRGDDADSERAKIVVSEAIKLAKNLDMRIVAEGIELKEQVDFLEGEGCDMIQGFYYDKPLPSDEYETRMKKKVS